MKDGAVFPAEGAVSLAVDDDLLILEQILTGQKELFRLLVKRYEKEVYGMGFGFFHNREDASDFTQEVFLKVFRSLSRFEGRSRFSTWLYKIAYNTGLNHVKRKKEYQSLAEEETIPDKDTPEKKVLKDFFRDSILEALKSLPERFRICVDLFFFHDRSLKEIEVITGYPVNTVKSHVFRAKKLLRNKLEGITEGGIE
jgi:RNA polymerase sigma-70 factor (ECF subfamily)